MDDDRKEAFEFWLNHESYDLNSKDINDLISSFEDDFQGTYIDQDDYSYEIVDECYDLPKFAKTYFDYEKFARDFVYDRLLVRGWLRVSALVMLVENYFKAEQSAFLNCLYLWRMIYNIAIK